MSKLTDRAQGAVKTQQYRDRLDAILARPIATWTDLDLAQVEELSDALGYTADDKFWNM